MNTPRKVIHEDKIVVKQPGQFFSQRNPGDQHKHEQEETIDTRPVILYVITRIDWEDEEQSLYDLCRYFAPDYQVHVAYGAYQYRGRGTLRDKLRELDITLHPQDNLTDTVVLLNEVRLTWQLLRLIHKLDPVVIHTYDAKTTMLAGIASAILRHKSRLVASIYELADTRWYLGIEQRFVRWVRTQAYHMADELIVPDDYLLAQAKEQFGVNDSLNLIRPGLSEIEFVDSQRKRHAVAQDAHESLGVKVRNSQTIIMGNIAPLEPEHNLVFVLQALTKLRTDGYQFVYIHYGEGSQRGLLEHEIQQFDLDDWVVLKGHDSMAHQYLTMLDMVVHPSSSPGVPQLVQTAGLARTALVLSPTPGLEDAVVDEKEVMFVPERDAESLAEMLAYLIEHPEKRRSMGKALESRVRADYQADEMRRRTRELYGIQ